MSNKTQMLCNCTNRCVKNLVKDHRYYIKFNSIELLKLKEEEKKLTNTIQEKLIRQLTIQELKKESVQNKIAIQLVKLKRLQHLIQEIERHISSTNYCIRRCLDNLVIC